MKEFKELNIADNDKIFNCNKVHIADILNCKIVVIDYQEQQSKYKDNNGNEVMSFVVLFAYYEQGKELEQMKQAKFFTNSNYLKEMFKKAKENMPYIATIRQINGKYFKIE
jgi:hypothetical protein